MSPIYLFYNTGHIVSSAQELLPLGDVSVTAARGQLRTCNMKSTVLMHVCTVQHETLKSTVFMHVCTAQHGT